MDSSTHCPSVPEPSRLIEGPSRSSSSSPRRSASTIATRSTSGQPVRRRHLRPAAKPWTARKRRRPPVVTQWPHVGSAYRGLVMIGQAVNGWADDCKAADLREPAARAAMIASIRSRVDKPEPLDWIDSHRVRTSPFWHGIRRFIEALEPDIDAPWYARFAWVNLYPIRARGPAGQPGRCAEGSAGPASRLAPACRHALARHQAGHSDRRPVLVARRRPSRSRRPAGATATAPPHRPVRRPHLGRRLASEGRESSGRRARGVHRPHRQCRSDRRAGSEVTWLWPSDCLSGGIHPSVPPCLRGRCASRVAYDEMGGLRYAEGDMTGERILVGRGSEAPVERAFNRWLEREGWRIIIEPGSWAGVVATRGDERLVGEVKGYPGANTGLDVGTMFGQLLRRMKPGARRRPGRSCPDAEPDRRASGPDRRPQGARHRRARGS